MQYVRRRFSYFINSIDLVYRRINDDRYDFSVSLKNIKIMKLPSESFIHTVKFKNGTNFIDLTKTLQNFTIWLHKSRIYENLDFMDLDHTMLWIKSVFFLNLIPTNTS